MSIESEKTSRRESGNSDEKEKEPCFEIKTGWDTSPCERHPDRNEDSVLENRKTDVYAVCDGLGGYEGGDIASQLASEYIDKRTQQIFSHNPDIEQAGIELKNLFREIDKKISEEAERRGQPHAERMGTTATVLKLFRKRGKALIVHQGDCRVYRLGADGVFEQVTLDHDIVRQMIPERDSARVMQKKFSDTTNLEELSDVEKSMFMMRNITSALGTGRVDPDLYVVDTQKGEKFLMTSDGIHDNLTSQEIADILAKSAPPRQLARELIEGAKKRSREGVMRAKPDDMSALVINIKV